MKLISPEQVKAFNAILRKHHLSDDKEDIICKISAGRTRSTKELTFEEARNWIAAMNRSTPAKADPRQRMVNNIIAMARETGVVYRETVIGKEGAFADKTNYTRLDQWMLNLSYLKKPLRAYTYEELPRLVSQYKNVYLSALKKQ